MCYNNRGAIIGEEILSPLLQASLVTCAKLLFAVQRQRNFEGLPSRRQAAPGFFRFNQTLWLGSRGAIIGEEILSPLLQAPLVTCAKLLFAVQRQCNFEGLPSCRSTGLVPKGRGNPIPASGFTAHFRNI